MKQGSLCRGLTLAEMMITLAVATILIMWGGPSLRALFANARADARVYSLYQDLAQARHMALSYQATVTLCPLSAGNRCDGQWQRGYRVFVDSPPLQTLDDSDLTLISRDALPSGDHLKYSAAVNAIRFDADGFTGQNGSFYYCSDQDQRNHPVRVIISRTGRVRLESHDGSNGCR